MKSITISADKLYVAISAYKQLGTVSVEFAPIVNNEITISFSDFRFYQLVESHLPGTTCVLHETCSQAFLQVPLSIKRMNEIREQFDAPSKPGIRHRKYTANLEIEDLLLSDFFRSAF